jgi:hypothetical protein
MIKSIRLITAALLAFFPLLLLSQTFTIGTFDGENNSNSYPTPFGDRRENTRAQYLYLSSELTAAGATAGNITKVGFNVIDVTGVGVHENWTLKLLLTSSTTLTNGTWQAGATTLYGPVNYTPTVGLNEFVLSSPFYWSGAANANLVIEICHSDDLSTNNAVVQLTYGLAFNGSRTRAKDDDAAICNTEETEQQGPTQRRPVLSLTFCYPPTDLTLEGVTSTTASMSWTPPAGNAPAGYDYSYGLIGYQPGIIGDELGSGSTTLTSTTLTSLNGLENYAFWVRSDCGDGYSRWEGPLNFTTEPSCFDLFWDSGGPLPYGPNEDYVKTYCPDIADNALTMNFFDPVAIGSGDTLRIYNGDNTDKPLLAALTGIYTFPDPLPGPFTCTTASGCLTVHFTSDDITTPQELGWFAVFSCAPLPLDACYEVLELEASNITPISAQMSWLAMFGAGSYEWELVELPYLGPGSVVASNPTYLNTQVLFTTLESGTSYQFAVRTNCINGVSSAWDTITFNTPVNCNGDLIECNQTYSFSASKTGLWNITECGTPTPGKERIFRFIAPQTKSYNFEILSASGGYVSYLIKTEAEGCDDADWECIDDFNVPGISSLPAAPSATLTAGTMYYILADPQTTDPVVQSFKITECSVPNDLPTNAIEIQVNTACEDNIHSNIGATLDPNEPDPDIDDSDGLAGRWLDDADETVWFRFQAPPSGTITIFTNPNGIYSPNSDTQVALYEVGDPADYSTYQLLVSDEDNGTTNLGFNSVVSYTGLIDGEYYYIQVDGYGASGEGAFCIAVIETVERLEEANCDADYTLLNVNENKWYNIWATPDGLDIGPLVAAINPLGLDLDSVLCRVQKYNEVPVSNDDFPYLPFYYYFESTEPFVGNVMLRLFFTDEEFTALKDSAATPNATLDDLEVTRFNKEISDCNLLNNSGQFILLNSVSATPLVGTFYLEITTDSLGEFGGRLNPPLLPLTLQSFSGKVKEDFNLLEWTTLSEKNVAWHIVERAADGKNWKEIGRLAGQANSTAPLRYELEDRLPLAKAYYRLRSVDFDGSAAVSHAISLTRNSETFGIANLFPSPTSDRLNVQFFAENEEDATIRLTDFTGRVLLEKTFAAAKGVNEAQLSLRQFPAGIYSVTLANGESVSAPVRVVKQ